MERESFTVAEVLTRRLTHFLARRRLNWMLLSLLTLSIVAPSSAYLDWNFDWRATRPPGTQTRAALDAAQRLRSKVFPVEINFDWLLGTVGSVYSRDAYLTPPMPGYPEVEDPHLPVTQFLHEYRDLFGGGPELLSTTWITEESVGVFDGVRRIIWSQRLDGIPIFGALLSGWITRRGELLSVGNSLVPDPAAASGRSTLERQDLYRHPPVGELEALRIALRNIGEQSDPVDVRPGADVQLYWLGSGRTELRFCWYVKFVRGDGAAFGTLVDAEYAEVLYRRILTTDWPYPETRRTQSISFEVPDTLEFPAEPMALNPSASSFEPVELTVRSGPAKLTGRVLRLLGIGEVVIIATQRGDNLYQAASPVERRMRILPTLNPRRLGIFPTSLSTADVVWQNPNNDYYLESSQSLAGEWIAVPTPPISEDGVAHLQVPIGRRNLFYRLRK